MTTDRVATGIQEGSNMADFLGLMKQATQLQSKMQALQAELDQMEVEGAAGGGLVTVRMSAKGDLKGDDIAVLDSASANPWQIVCEHLRCAPPACSFPILKDLRQRPICDRPIDTDHNSECKSPKRDRSPWVVEPRRWWQGSHWWGLVWWQSNCRSRIERGGQT